MEMKRFDEEHCVICHCEFDPLDYPSIEVGKKGIESLIKFSKRRNYKKLRSYLSVSNKILYTTLCCKTQGTIMKMHIKNTDLFYRQVLYYHCIT